MMIEYVLCIGVGILLVNSVFLWDDINAIKKKIDILMGEVDGRGMGLRKSIYSDLLQLETGIHNKLNKQHIHLKHLLENK